MSRRLRIAREDAGITRPALATLIGISLRAVNYYEDPSYARARKEIVVRAWADACGREFKELWGNASDQPWRQTGCMSESPAPDVLSLAG